MPVSYTSKVLTVNIIIIVVIISVFSQLVEKAQMDFVKEEIEDLLKEIYPFLKEQPASTNTTGQSSMQQRVIAKMVTEVIGWAKDLVEAGKSSEVSFFCLQGRVSFSLLFRF